MHRFRTIPKANTTARGYGQAHRKAREHFRDNHQPTDPCTRCHLALGPWGPWLHLDHRDDRLGYRGMAHRSCNIRAGARAGNRAQRKAPRRRRAW